MRTLTYVVLALMLAGCAAQAATIPGPPEVKIIPPAPGLAPEFAAFSGTWEGTWGGVLPSRLIVETIDAESARVVYAWADHPEGRFKGGWGRYRAKVLPVVKLEFGSSQVKFRFEMAKDRMSIHGEREQEGTIATVTMTKVSR